MRRTILSFLHQFIECWSKCGRSEKLKTALNGKIAAPCAKLAFLTNATTSWPFLVCRSIALDLHSYVLERVNIFLRELATCLLLVGHGSSLRVGGWVGLLCCCHAPRSAEWIVRWKDWLFVRFRMGTKKNEAFEGTPYLSWACICQYPSKMWQRRIGKLRIDIHACWSFVSESVISSWILLAARWSSGFLRFGWGEKIRKQTRLWP